jgi:hypothetical protein
MHGRVLVRTVTLPSTTAVPARRVVPSRYLPATLRDEHLYHDGHSVTTRLSTSLFDHHRHSDGHHTRMPATLRLRSDRQHLDRMPAAMSTGKRNKQHDDDRLSAMPGERHWYVQHQSHCGLLSSAVPAPLHGRQGLSDDRLPSRPAVPAASMPHVQWQQPVLSMSRTAE